MHYVRTEGRLQFGQVEALAGEVSTGATVSVRLCRGCEQSGLGVPDWGG